MKLRNMTAFISPQLIGINIINRTFLSLQVPFLFGLYPE